MPERSVSPVIVPPEPDRKKTILALTKRYEERGWGEVSETSYHAFLLWLEDTLNSEFMRTNGRNSTFGLSICTPAVSSPAQFKSPVET